MNGTMLVFPVNGQPRGYKFDKPIALEQLKCGIGGGWLEVVPHFKTIALDFMIIDCIAFCDEEGKLKGLPYNELATGIWEMALERRGLLRGEDYLAGDIAVVFGDREFMQCL